MLDAEIVAECENGRQAIAEVERCRPDLIISDVRMPVMDGLAMAEKLAEMNFDGAVIFYSGYSDFEYVRKAMEYGVSGYVLKPEENDLLTRKAAETIAVLEERRKKSNALQSLSSGAAYIKEIYFRKLEEGVDDRSLRDQLSVLNISLPRSGTVLYGKALRMLDAAFEELYRALLRALDNFKAVGDCSREKFIIVTGLTDADALRECAERLYGECGKNASFACVGLSGAFGADADLCTAAAQAKAAASPVFEVGGVFSFAEAGMRGGKKLKKIAEDALALIVAHYIGKDHGQVGGGQALHLRKPPDARIQRGDGRHLQRVSHLLQDREGERTARAGQDAHQRDRRGGRVCGRAVFRPGIQGAGRDHAERIYRFDP